uniref:Trypsin-1-like n=1 Tax=Drosophila rhopaloa TaxID=1041015 RepID=A0A6P4FN78_DRORH
MFHSLVLLQFVALPWLVIGEHRIIGGNTESIKVVPWYGSLIANSKLKCGGVLVKNNYFLTAAKCVDGFDVSDLQLRLGTSSCESGGSKVGVCKVKVHPQYSSWRFDNNLALLRTCEPLVATDEGAPLVIDGKLAGIMALGDCSKKPEVFINLFHHKTWLESNSKDKSDWKKIGLRFSFLLKGISELTLCTQTSGKGASVYDMGDPLVVDNKLVGILSKPGCSARPDVYANLNQHKTWLDDNTKE